MALQAKRMPPARLQEQIRRVERNVPMLFGTSEVLELLSHIAALEADLASVTHESGDRGLSHVHPHPEGEDA